MICACSKTNTSFVFHFRAISHAPSNIECTTLFNPDRFELPTVCKCVSSDFPKRAGKRDLFDFTKVEAHFSDTLSAILNYYTLEVLAPTERLGFEPL